MAQRAKRRSPQARKAPPWVPDEALRKLGDALGDESFAQDARRTPFVWHDGLLRVVDHLGGVLAPSELANGTPVSSALPAVNRFVESAELEPLPTLELAWDADGAGAEGDEHGEELERLRKERDRLAADLTRLPEKADEKDR